jgi:hypothetical protein
VNYETIIKWAAKKQPKNISRYDQMNEQRTRGFQQFNELNLYDGDPIFRIIPEVRDNPATEKVKNSSKRPDITIPEMLVKIYPTLSEEEFANLITDKHWLGNVVKICESCVFELAKQSPFGGVYEDPNIDAKIKFAGIGPQDPKRLSERRQKTIEKIVFDNNLSKGQKSQCDRLGVGIGVSKAGFGSKEGGDEPNLGLPMSIDEGPEWASTETARGNPEEK